MSPHLTALKQPSLLSLTFYVVMLTMVSKNAPTRSVARPRKKVSIKHLFLLSLSSLLLSLFVSLSCSIGTFFWPFRAFSLFLSVCQSASAAGLINLDLLNCSETNINPEISILSDILKRKLPASSVQKCTTRSAAGLINVSALNCADTEIKWAHLCSWRSSVTSRLHPLHSISQPCHRHPQEKWSL